MALKFISITDLLLIRGGGGVSGDNGCRANTHAGVVVPLTSKRAFPLDHDGGARGAFKITGGEAQSQHPWGFQATDPTAPTDPANLDGAACPSSFDDIGQARNTDVLVDAGYLESGIESGKVRYSIKRRIKGQSARRVYVVRSTILES